jgi:hypothetical protein
MPLEKGIEKNLPYMLKAHTVDLMCYVYVDAITSVIPGVSLIKAIEMFKKHWNLSDEDYENETAKQMFYRHTENEFKNLNIKK